MNNFIGFKKEEIEKTIHERFEKIVSLYPQNIAIQTEQKTLTYEALNKKANQLARTILNQCELGQASVLLLMEDEVDLIASMLAVLKVGKIYVIVLPSFPKERLNLIKNETKTKLIITNSQNLNLAQELTQNNLKLINIDTLNPDLEQNNLGLYIAPESIASIAFTSGSTGKAKGIIMSYRFFLHRIYHNTNKNKILVNDRFLTLSNKAFVGWSGSVFSYLLNGGALIPYDFKILGILPLKDWLINHKITCVTFTSQVFTQFLDSLKETTELPSLRQINIAMEKLYKKDVERLWHCIKGNYVLKHGYGSSETGGFR